jgi:hypothetical protein
MDFHLMNFLLTLDPLSVWRSVQDVPFQYWLPLPLSETHWERVKGDVDDYLTIIVDECGYSNLASEYILFKILNDAIIKLSKDVEKNTYISPIYPYEETAQSTLTHASEKAIESYFHIFHLLLCKAMEEPVIVKYTNTLLTNFANGQQSKEFVSNIGHLLIATLISEVDITPRMTQGIISPIMNKEWFTKFLQERMQVAWNIGYFGMPLTQEQAMSLRRDKEPNIDVMPGKFFMPPPKPEKDGVYNFSPNRRGRGGARGGRERGKGRGRRR